MPGLHIITGGNASGKTELLLSRLGSRYLTRPLESSLVLVPTVRHGDQFRRRLVQRCGVAFGLQVATVQQWSRAHLAAAVPPPGVLAAWLERVTAEAIRSGGAEHFAPLAGTAGLRDLVARAVSDLLADAVPPHALTRAAGTDAKLRALAAVYSAFHAGLEARGWVHPAALAGAAAAALASETVPGLVLVDGFQVLRRGEVALIAALAQHAEVVVAFDPGAGDRAAADYEALRRAAPATEERATHVPASPRRAASAAADREAELRAIAREVKQVLADHPTLRPSDCAVAFRQVGPYLALARQVFREYDLPLDPAAGERLAERPLGAWLRRLLHLVADGWRLRDLVAVLSSAFIDGRRWGLEPGHVATIAREGRRQHLWAGERVTDALAEALSLRAFDEPGPDGDDGAEPRPAEDEARRARRRAHLQEAERGLRAAVADLRALLEVAPAPLREHARALDHALFGPAPLVAPAARMLDGAGVELDALRGYLRAIAAADEALAGRPVPFAEFVARLGRELDAPAVLLREPGGVLLAPLHTLHGLRFAYLAVGGLVEGEFPARRTATPLLDREARAKLAAGGVDLPPEPRAAEATLSASFESRADTVLSLWRSRLDGRGRPAPPSFYFDAAASALASPAVASRREGAVDAARRWASGEALRPAGVAAWPVVRAAVHEEQRRRSRAGADAYDGLLPPVPLGRLTGAAASWSASRLETYGTCPFQFFGRYALRLRELDEELDAADPPTRGRVVHEILEDALAPLREAGQPLAPHTVEAAVARLRTAGRRMWDRAPEQYGFGRAGLWRLEGDETLRQIESLLREEAERSAGVECIAGTEEWVEAVLPLVPPLRVGSRIDRLDAGPGLAVVVDYKSGRAISRADVERGRYLQLQLYAHLARVRTGAERVVARYAFLRPPDEPWELDTARDQDAQLVDDAVCAAGDTRARVEAGDFRVLPSGDCPRWCSFRHACRKNEVTPWKWA